MRHFILHIFYFLLKENQPTIKVPQDKLLAELVLKHKDNIWKIHDHDSLLENQVDEHLTEEERKAAWDEFENEKKGIINMTNSVNLNQNLVMSQINPEMIRVRLFHILLYRVVPNFLFFFNFRPSTGYSILTSPRSKLIKPLERT